MMSGISFSFVYMLKALKILVGIFCFLVTPLGLPFQLLQDVLFPYCTETSNKTYDTLALVPLYHHYIKLSVCCHSDNGSFCFMSWCIKFFCAVGPLCMFSYF